MAILTGCAASSGAIPIPVGLSQRMEGSWSDLRAAVNFIASGREMTVLRTSKESERAMAFELFGARDERVIIRAQRRENSPDGTIAALTVRIQVGRFGDEQRESEMLRSLRHRLVHLARNHNGASGITEAP